MTQTTPVYSCLIFNASIVDPDRGTVRPESSSSFLLHRQCPHPHSTSPASPSSLPHIRPFSLQYLAHHVMDASLSKSWKGDIRKERKLHRWDNLPLVDCPFARFPWLSYTSSMIHTQKESNQNQLKYWKESTFHKKHDTSYRINITHRKERRALAPPTAMGASN